MLTSNYTREKMDDIVYKIYELQSKERISRHNFRML
jgi:hypothetical protein